jgi:hypothetical protein
MKELRNNVDRGTTFNENELEKAKIYYIPDVDEFPECKEYADEITEAETLDELASVLNKYTDVYENGSSWSVVEF